MRVTRQGTPIRRLIDLDRMQRLVDEGNAGKAAEVTRTTWRWDLEALVAEAGELRELVLAMGTFEGWLTGGLADLHRAIEATREEAPE